MDDRRPEERDTTRMTNVTIRIRNIEPEEIAVLEQLLEGHDVAVTVSA